VKSRSPDLIYVQGSTPQLLVILRDAAKVGLAGKQFMGNLYNISPAIPAQLSGAAEGFRAIQAYSDFGADIPAMKEINAFGEKHPIEKKDVFYMKGWLHGHVFAAAIANAIKKNGGSVPADIKAFRKTVRDEMEGLKDLDVGGITPPLNYADHQGTVQARIAEIKNGNYVPQGEWIQAR
jgi:branched-chain amino acid transport system substrate-binding protein